MRRWRTIGLGTLLCFVWVAGVGVTGASAAEVHRERHVQIPAGTTVAGGLVADGLTVEVFGDVAGDLHARAGYLNQVGDVAGDVVVTAGRVELRGAIGGSVRVVGGSVDLYGTVAGDVDLTGGQLTLVEGSDVAGNVVVHGGTLIEVATAQIGGNLTGQVAEATIEGEVGHDVDLAVGRLTLAPGARIDGALRYESRTVARVDPAAVVAGPITRRDPAASLPYGSVLLWHEAALPRFLLMLAVGGATILLRPGWAIAVADTPRRAPLATALSGLGVALLAPLVLLLLALPVVTLPLAAFGGVIYLATAYFSMVVVGLSLGRAALRRSPGEHRRRVNLVAMAGGTGALALVRLAPIPHFGILSSAAIAVVGFGALVERRQREDERAATAEPPPHPIVSTFLGVAVGGVATALALAAVAIAAVGASALLATASHSASFVWTVAPRRFALLALVCVVSAGVLLMMGIALTRRDGNPDRNR